ncbi:hypothetical protein EQG49_04475 [Periweissella cryptocerci]|uniref:MucBP domain-containing protein n=1 Tax=Periweissella cryptocerci TaxID=2506420 RepID=A0A4P6YSY2_9LACO|nr:MucBP domain-containing protein [Periweissella cryptocerci]QBO35770.1 hypothetical protein EQG49_04475 [Periweissella cryptocerci]
MDCKKAVGKGMYPILAIVLLASTISVSLAKTVDASTTEVQITTTAKASGAYHAKSGKISLFKITGSKKKGKLVATGSTSNYFHNSFSISKKVTLKQKGKSIVYYYSSGLKKYVLATQVISGQPTATWIKIANAVGGTYHFKGTTTGFKLLGSTTGATANAKKNGSKTFAINTNASGFKKVVLISGTKATTYYRTKDGWYVPSTKLVAGLYVAPSKPTTKPSSSSSSVASRSSVAISSSHTSPVASSSSSVSYGKNDTETSVVDTSSTSSNSGVSSSTSINNDTQPSKDNSNASSDSSSPSSTNNAMVKIYVVPEDRGGVSITDDAYAYTVPVGSTFADWPAVDGYTPSSNNTPYTVTAEKGQYVYPTYTKDAAPSSSSSTSAAKTTVTVHYVDQSGTTIAPDTTIATTVGSNVTVTPLAIHPYSTTAKNQTIIAKDDPASNVQTYYYTYDTSQLSINEISTLVAANRTLFTEQFLQLVNADRASLGLQPVTLDESSNIQTYSDTRADEGFQNGLQHIRLDGSAISYTEDLAMDNPDASELFQGFRYNDDKGYIDASGVKHDTGAHWYALMGNSITKITVGLYYGNGLGYKDGVAPIAVAIIMK